MVSISYDEMTKAQKGDGEIQKICCLLEADDDMARKLAKKYEVIDGQLHRKNSLSGLIEGTGMSRVYVPTSLRIAVLNNAHSSVWGGHRNSVATFKEIVGKYYWPCMDDECQKYVHHCE